ncbi:hypothetical protein H6501_05140 [Candidatus Woesearchaeota archaeon]|nr:hypothetical protein [Nanoarchaeota archaeon]MCB9370958.1 hypothetical protein [Candidatus Woesearchaeota archaeon]USN44060.1 MAG: hypothetical protein H6500_06755 [Candidatus Woesearchaeota archaeon]
MVSDSGKIKDAFMKVKQDVTTLQKEILELRQEVASNTPTNKRREQEVLPSTLPNIEKELGEIRSLSKTFQEKFLDNSLRLQSFSEELDKFREDLLLTRKNSQNTQTQIDTKDQIEKGVEELRLELSTDLAQLAADVQTLKTQVSSSTQETTSFNVEKMMAEFAEMINEKITVEMAAMRLEFQEELAQRELRSQLSHTQNNSQKESPKKVNSEKSKKTNTAEISPREIEEVVYEDATTKKSGGLKKTLRKLFVDEDEDEEDTVKAVKEASKGKK